MFKRFKIMLLSKMIYINVINSIICYVISLRKKINVIIKISRNSNYIMMLINKKCSKVRILKTKLNEILRFVIH